MNTSTVGSKRSYSDNELNDTDGNETNKRSCLDGDIRGNQNPQHIFTLVFLNQEEYAAKNQAWLNSRDIQSLFPSDLPEGAASSAKYLQVANKIYRVAALDSLIPGMLAFSKTQTDEVDRSAFLLDGRRCVIATAMSDLALPKDYATNLSVEIDASNDTVSARTGPLRFNLHELRQSVAQTLKGHVISVNQKFHFVDPKGNFTLTVKGIRSDSSSLIADEFGDFPHIRSARVSDYTLIDFNTFGYDVVIIDNIFEADVKSLEFHLTTVNSNQKTYPGPLPIVVDVTELDKKAKETFGGQVVEKGEKFTLITNHTHNLRGRLSSSVKTDPMLIAGEEKDNGYKQGYRLGWNTPITFNWNSSDIIVTKGPAQPSKSITFTVEDVIQNQQSKLSGRKQKSYISAEELETAILKQEDTFVVGKKFYVELGAGVYLVKVTKQKGEDWVASDKYEMIKTPFFVYEETEIKLETAPKVKAKFIDSNQSYPIKKIRLKVSKQTNPFKNLFPGTDEEDPITMVKEVDLKEAFCNQVKGKILPNQKFTIHCTGNNRVNLDMESYELEKPEELHTIYNLAGKLSDKTELVFVSDKDTGIAILPDVTRNVVKNPIEKLEELGVGGLSSQMKEIVRNIFIGRGPMNKEMKRRGMTQERGILFYGPPGTGKTAMARSLAMMLGAAGDNVQMISGPEMFNKWAGASEKNVRDLFEPAINAQKLHGEDSPLFVIIIDEVDALLAAREDDGGSKWRNSVVNQFLAMIDGPKSLENILVIGMTNKKDSMDVAALRSGRLSLHIEIGMPDKAGREKIFEIHTKLLKREELLAEDILPKELAEKTEGFTGADIKGVVQRANAYSMERLTELDLSEKEVSCHPKGKVTLDDFLSAIEHLKKGKQPGNDPMSEGAKRMYQ